MPKYLKNSNDIKITETGDNIKFEFEKEKLLDLIYPIGSIYMSSQNVSPQDFLGGTWELQREYHGGELIAVGSLANKNIYEYTLTRDRMVNISAFYGNSNVQVQQDIENYVPGILSYKSGTFSIKPQGIVGFVDLTLSISGYSKNGAIGIWHRCQELSEGLKHFPNFSKNEQEDLLIMGQQNTYGGNTIHEIIKVEDSYPQNTPFYADTAFSAYNGDIAIGSGGTKTIYTAKVYSKGGTTYVWKRIG